MWQYPDLYTSHTSIYFLFVCCSGGCFIAVKEVSLLDQGEQGRQSVLQLEQVGNARLLFYLSITMICICCCLRTIYLLIIMSTPGNCSFKSV